MNIVKLGSGWVGVSISNILPEYEFTKVQCVCVYDSVHMQPCCLLAAPLCRLVIWLFVLCLALYSNSVFIAGSMSTRVDSLLMLTPVLWSGQKSG